MREDKLIRKCLTLLLASLPLLLASCIKDDDVTYTPTDYCYISHVRLGNIRRAVPVQGKDGKDSVVYTSFTASSYEMIVDHRRLFIQNRDSLLFGAQARAVAVTIGFEGAALMYRPADADSTEQWKKYDSADSLDLRKDMHLYVLSNDGNSSRTYTLRLNIHQQEPDSLYWTRVDSVETFDGMQQTKAFVHANSLMVLGQTPAGIILTKRSTLGEAGEWEAETTNLPHNTEVHTLRQRTGNLFLSTTDGALLTSTDGCHWTELGTARSGLQLVDVSSSYLYALIDGAIYRSTDGEEWEKEALDEDALNLPSRYIHSVHLTQPNGLERTVLVGYRDGEIGQSDTTAVVWTKSWNSTFKEEDAEWVYINPTDDNKHLCPRLEQMILLPYDDRCLLFGGASEEGHGHCKSMETMYFSKDYGITWKAHIQPHLPTETQGVSGPIAAAVDNDNYLWIIANHQVWRGRINRLGFARR